MQVLQRLAEVFNPCESHVLSWQPFATLEDILESVQMAMRAFFVTRPASDNIEMVLKMPQINQWYDKWNMMTTQQVIFALYRGGGVTTFFIVQTGNIYITQSNGTL